MGKKVKEMKQPTHNDYKKVRHEGGNTVVLSMGKLIPSDWKVVRLDEVETRPDEYVVVCILKIA